MRAEQTITDGRTGTVGQPPQTWSPRLPQSRAIAPMAFKRFLDVILCMFLLAAALFLLVPACLAIRLESRGPVLYRQWRAGRDGRDFQILKLRTMVHGADLLGPALTQDADPRVTRIGSSLRRWSIDELPQLINVIVGHMSLVGPRPELVAIAADYTLRQRQVLSVRPGLTGWAQVNGRDDLSIADKLDLELDYVMSRTIFWDFRIMARTIGVVMSGRGTKW
jgi:lipopolysaccharide/colanic/teichoic acid biosynthesis glycosyltransferase